jgi:hypothetical protein
MSFGKDLERFQDKVEHVTVNVYRSSVFDLFSAVVMSTPVDKGTLRGSWFVSIGPGLFTGFKGARIADAGGSATVGKIRYKVGKLEADNTVYLTNNLPYGPRIEFDGHSGKAPEGMVRINAARWEDIVKANARKYGS